MENKSNGKLLSHLFKYIRNKLAQEQANVLIEFAEKYYESVVFDDFERVSVEDLYGSILSHWNLALEFNGEQKIHIYNPTLEDHGWQSKHTIIEIVVKDMPFMLQSISMEVNRHGFTNHLVIHPVYVIKRNHKGQFLSFADANSDEMS
jgi:glutamate dehydrogenase